MSNNKLTVAHKAKGKIVTPEEKSLYDIINKVPEPSSRFELTTSQRYWWFWLGKEIVETKQMCKVDLTHLQRAAIWLDVRCKANSEMNRLGYDGGWIQTFKNGTNNVTAHVSVMEKADKALDEISKHFGFSMMHRQKLKVDKIDDSQLDLFQNVMKKLAE